MLLKLTGTFTDNTLPIYKRDAVLSGDNGGIKFLFDLAYNYSYAGGAPANGAPIVNINGSGSNGSVVLQAGQAIANSGGGFDFSGITNRTNALTMPAAAAADIWAAGAGLQYFLFCMYVKLPTNADWNTDGSMAPFMQFASPLGSYQSEADLLVIAQAAVTKTLSFRRQRLAATADVIGIQPVAADYGSFAQLAFWRNGTNQGARLKTANGTVLGTAATGAANTQDFSGKSGSIGVTSAFLGSTSNVNGAALTSAGQLNAVKWRLYRGWLENLQTSGRDPAAVLDADYARTVARGVFS